MLSVGSASYYSPALVCVCVCVCVGVGVGVDADAGNRWRDVTARYASDWCTQARRRRLGGAWWEEVYRLYSPPQHECRREDETVRGER